MLVATTFDLWQNDTFFSAAEEVQESADILQTAYRAWLRGKKEGANPNDLDELRRELQTTLGTAKWQMEEFERAVSLSYVNRRDENKIARHQEFIVAIESQISTIENALGESLEGGHAPLSWVDLNDQERDDLAIFLSGNYGGLRGKKDESSNLSFQEMHQHKNAGASCYSSDAYQGDTGVSSNQSDGVKDEIVVDISAREPNCIAVQDDTTNLAERITSSRRTCTSSNLSRLEIIIPDEDDHRRTLASSIEDTPKEKGPRISTFVRVKSLSLINQFFRVTSNMQRKVQSSQKLRFGRSVRLMLVLMLTLILFSIEEVLAEGRSGGLIATWDADEIRVTSKENGKLDLPTDGNTGKSVRSRSIICLCSNFSEAKATTICRHSSSRAGAFGKLEIRKSSMMRNVNGEALCKRQRCA